MGVPAVNKQTAIIFFYKIRFGKSFFLYRFICKGFIGIAPRKCQHKKQALFLLELTEYSFCFILVCNTGSALKNIYKQ